MTLREPVSIVAEGEVWLGKDMLKAINSDREKEGLPLFANPRNAAAGTIRQLDASIVAKRKLSLTTYDLSAGEQIPTQAEELKRLRELGFLTDSHWQVCTSMKDVLAFYTAWIEKKDSQPFWIDGIVVKVNEKNDELDTILAMPINSLLSFSKRVENFIELAKLTLVGDLVRMTSDQILKYKNTGKKSLREIKDKLAEKELKLGMSCPVGPLERQAILDSPIDQYFHPDFAYFLRDQGLSKVAQIKSLSPENLQNIWNDDRLRKFGTAKRAHSEIQQRLTKRGL
jgi:NAD-dependent DNA ligase